MKKILFYEPFFHGSHAEFAKSYVKHSSHSIDLFTVKGSQWKWNSRFSSTEMLFNPSSRALIEGIDILLCSGYTRLEGLKPLLHSSTKIVIYHHENQFSYPSRSEENFDFHFLLDAMMNLNLADLNIFNSEWNKSSCYEGYCRNRRRVPSQYRKWLKMDWLANAKVVHPGVNLEFISTQDQVVNNVPHILWNHRWEHDKRPDIFLRLLRDLKSVGIPFKLILLGETPSKTDSFFENFQNEFCEDIEHSGFVNSREEYFFRVKKGDIAISTADHEYFGLSMLEARAYGCRLILPDKLSYPEVYKASDSVFFYETYNDLLSIASDLLGKTEIVKSVVPEKHWDERNAFATLDSILCDPSF